VASVRRTLAEPGAPARASALAAELAGVLRDDASVPLLRARLAADPATVASAAGALARLAPAGIECQLVALLGRPEAEIGALLPSAVLDLAERDAPTRACLVRAAGTSGSAREAAIWIAASLGDDTFTPVLRAALVDGTPAVRRAAAWALGEAATDPPTGVALTRSAELDTDSIVRRMAAVAVQKQEGRIPRARLGTVSDAPAVPAHALGDAG
jgi:hypothetical protein